MRTGMFMPASGRNDPRPSELADEAAAGAIASGEIVGPSGVAFRLRQGARAEIDRIVGTNLNDRAALNSLLKVQTDWNRQRLTTPFGAERTGRLYRNLENERAMAETENRALAGSKPATLQAAQKEIDGPAKRPGVVRSATIFICIGVGSFYLGEGMNAPTGEIEEAYERQTLPDSFAWSNRN